MWYEDYRLQLGRSPGGHPGTIGSSNYRLSWGHQQGVTPDVNTLCDTVVGSNPKERDSYRPPLGSVHHLAESNLDWQTNPHSGSLKLCLSAVTRRTNGSQKGKNKHLQQNRKLQFINFPLSSSFYPSTLSYTHMHMHPSSNQLLGHLSTLKTVPNNFIVGLPAHPGIKLVGHGRIWQGSPSSPLSQLGWKGSPWGQGPPLRVLRHSRGLSLLIFSSGLRCLPTSPLQWPPN